MSRQRGLAATALHGTGPSATRRRRRSGNKNTRRRRRAGVGEWTIDRQGGTRNHRPKTGRSHDGIGLRSGYLPARSKDRDSFMGAGQAASALSALAPAVARLWAMVQGIACRVKVRRRERSLRVCETLSLGERRLLMVVQFE